MRGGTATGSRSTAWTTTWRCRTSPAVDLGDDQFTIMTWFRYSETTGSIVIWWFYQVGTGAAQIWLRAEPASNRIRGVVGTGQGDANITIAGAYNDGLWHHVAMRRTTTRVTVLIDGATVADLAAPRGSVTTGKEFGIHSVYLGRRVDGLNNTFHGALDEFRVYGRALSAEELRDDPGAQRTHRRAAPAPAPVHDHRTPAVAAASCPARATWRDIAIHERKTAPRARSGFGGRGKPDTGGGFGHRRSRRDRARQPARRSRRNSAISARAVLACGTTPGMLRNACVAPGCSVSRAGVPAARSRSAYARPWSATGSRVGTTTSAGANPLRSSAYSGDTVRGSVPSGTANRRNSSSSVTVSVGLSACSLIEGKSKAVEVRSTQGLTSTCARSIRSESLARIAARAATIEPALSPKRAIRAGSTPHRAACWTT